MHRLSQRLSPGGKLEGTIVQISIATQMPDNEDRGVDLTPMLDVVFIMLIFFIVTATFVKETGIDVSPPDTHQRTTIENTGTIIAIDENDRIWINSRSTDPRAVRANIERLHGENPKLQILIRADRRSTNKTLVQVMDASRQAGVYNLSLDADGLQGTEVFTAPIA
jgi:biopolymer transport protein ExbD